MSSNCCQPDCEPIRQQIEQVAQQLADAEIELSMLMADLTILNAQIKAWQDIIAALNATLADLRRQLEECESDGGEE